MALLRNRDLFTDKWRKGLRAVPESAMVAKIAVYTRTVSYANNVPTVAKSYVYGNASGAKARIQPLATALKTAELGDTVFPQRALFSIPMGVNSSPLVPETMFVDVISGGLNPELTRHVFVIREVMDSSNPIERTFIAEVDTSG